MLTMRAQNDTAATVSPGRKTFYSLPENHLWQMAAFMLARDAVIKKNYSEAENQLNWVIDHSSISFIRQIARIRLARI